KLRSPVAPARRFGPYIGEAALDVGYFEHAKLIFEIEVVRNERFDAAPDRRTCGLGCGAIRALLRACLRLQPEHLAHELRPHAVTRPQVLKHAELQRELPDF